MVDVLTSVGEKVYSFSVLTAVVSTVIALALLSAGVPPDMFNIPIFSGARVFASITYNIYQSIPTNRSMSATEFMWISATVLAGSALQFILAFLGATLLLINSIAYILPPHVQWLVTPLYFIGSFLQVSAWFYLVQKIKNILSSLSLFK